MARRSGPAAHFTSILLAGIASLLLAPYTPLHAQQLPLRTDPNTQVRLIHFQFTGTRSFTENDLRARISQTDRGRLTGVREFFSFLPIVEPVGEHLFDPLELQQDVVRLRSFYRRAGFPEPRISYDLAYDPAENLISVTFVIDEGPQVHLRSVRLIADSSGTPLSLPEALEREWKSTSPAILPALEKRLNLFDLPTIEGRVSVWFMERGYPFVRSRGLVTIDSANHAAHLSLRVDTGPQSRIGAITVEGAESVREQVLLRELPFRTGDLYSPGALFDGRREILGLGLFRRAVVQIPEGTLPAEVVPIRVAVTEAPPRLITGSAGYDSRGGLTGQADWQHRNFTGDARTFSVSALAQTGVWALEEIPEILYRGSLSLTQPYVFYRRLSLLGGPIVEHRNDYRDRSNAIRIKRQTELPGDDNDAVQNGQNDHPKAPEDTSTKSQTQDGA